MLKRFFHKKLLFSLSSFVSRDQYDVIIHIGAPKTGSSSLQKFFLENKEKLLKEGYYYPTHGLDQNGISGGHSNIGVALSNADNVMARTIFTEHLSQAKQNNACLLLSAESLFDYSTQLYELVSECRCKIVVFFRNPLESVFSSYNQGVKRHFQTMKIDQIYSNILKSDHLISYENKFEKWIKLFGKDNVVIFEYNLEFFKSMSIQELFLRFLQIDKRIISRIKPRYFKLVNKSYSLPELEFKRVINCVLDRDNIQMNERLDWILQKRSDESNEYRKLIDTISPDVRNALELKYHHVRSKLLDMGMIIIRNNNIMDTSFQTIPYFYKEKINDILNIIDYLKKHERDLFEYLLKSIKLKVYNGMTPTLEMLSLSQWFDIDLPLEKDYWFHQFQLENMLLETYQKPDFLRDIATLLLHRHDLSNAKKVISKALELRPNGPAIIELNKKVMELLCNQPV